MNILRFAVNNTNADMIPNPKRATGTDLCKGDKPQAQAETVSVILSEGGKNP